MVAQIVTKLWVFCCDLTGLNLDLLVYRAVVVFEKLTKQVFMKHIVLMFVLLTTVAAMGQSLENQKACYVQAHKVASKETGTVVSNHYDGRTHTCWVKEFKETKSVAGIAVDESVYNAFEPNVWEAEFAGAVTVSATATADNPFAKLLKPSTPIPQAAICFVNDTKCSNVAEFEKLVKQRYGF